MDDVMTPASSAAPGPDGRLPVGPVRWPGPGALGVRIGEAAALLGISAKTIRVYHRRGLVPEPERDESGYRRYGAGALVTLARIVRLRRVGFSLCEIEPLVTAPDCGAALRRALRDLDELLAEDVAERRRRRALLGQLLDEGIDDPIAVAAPDVWEEQSVAWLRQLVPDLSAEHELVERRLSRAMAALIGSAPGTGDEPLIAALEAPLDMNPGMQAEIADRHRRFHALADIDPDDPRVEQLIADMREPLATMVQALYDGNSSDGPVAAAGDVAMAGIAAALEVLPPAQRRVMDAVLRSIAASAPADPVAPVDRERSR